MSAQPMYAKGSLKSLKSLVKKLSLEIFLGPSSIPLDKNPGLLPTEIGKVLHRYNL